jgi:hypothetical protein
MAKPSDKHQAIVKRLSALKSEMTDRHTQAKSHGQQLLGRADELRKGTPKRPS